MLIRLFWLILKRLFFFKKTDLFKPVYTSFIVSPFDLDTNFHMNNGRYLSIMDLGRYDMLVKPKLFWKLVRAGYYPVVVSESIRFKKSLGLFQKFTIQTEIDSWDEKDFYIKQIFYVKNEIAAVGYIKGRFKKRGVKSSIATNEIFSFLGYSGMVKEKTPLALGQDKVESELNQIIYSNPEK